MKRIQVNPFVIRLVITYVFYTALFTDEKENIISYCHGQLKFCHNFLLISFVLYQNRKSKNNIGVTITQK